MYVEKSYRGRERKEKKEDSRKLIRRFWGDWKMKEARRASAARLDRGLVRKTVGKNSKTTFPSVTQIGKEFRVSQRLHLKACRAVDAQDKSTRFTVCLHKTQIPSASKTMIFPGAYEQEFAPMGSLNWSTNRSQKQHFKGFQKLWGLSLSQTWTKQTSALDSPADTCGCEVPKGLEMSLVFSPPLIRACWKQQYISLVLCTQHKAKTKEKGSKQRKRKQQRKREI